MTQQAVVHILNLIEHIQATNARWIDAEDLYVHYEKRHDNRCAPITYVYIVHDSKPSTHMVLNLDVLVDMLTNPIALGSFAPYYMVFCASAAALARFIRDQLIDFDFQQC